VLARIIRLAGVVTTANQPPISRRGVLGGVAAAAGALALGAGTAAAETEGPDTADGPGGGNDSPGTAPADLDVHVLVIDGCRPDEIAAGAMPTVRLLAAQGSSYPNARAVDVPETIPNHVAMMSGVLPNRSGVPANAVYDRAEAVVRDLDRPTDLLVSTLLERLPAERGVRTASILSNDYLFGIFGTRASYR